MRSLQCNVVLLLSCTVLAQRPSPRPSSLLGLVDQWTAPPTALRTQNSADEGSVGALTWGAYASNWCRYLLRLDDLVEDTLEDLGDASSRFVFRDVLGLRVGWARARHLLLQAARMALGWSLILRGGQLARPALFIEAAQLLSFSLTTARTLAGLPRVPAGWREAAISLTAAGLVHAPHAARAIPALSLGLHVGKAARGLIRASRAVDVENDGWGEAAAKAAGEVVDDVTDSVVSALGAEDWWDDEPTVAEAEQARWRLAGRAVSASLAAAACTAAVRAPSLPGGVGVSPAAAAVAGAFMFQRNAHLVLAENWLYLRLRLLRLVPTLLKVASWLLWRVVWPMKGVAIRLGGRLRSAWASAVSALHWLLTSLCPPLKRVEGLSPGAVGRFVLALPGLGKQLTKKLVQVLLDLGGLLVPTAARQFLAEVLDRSERHFLPFLLAALGLALQSGRLQLAQLPALLLAALLNPAGLLVPLAKPVVRAALAELRTLLQLPSAAAAMLKA